MLQPSLGRWPMQTQLLLVENLVQICILLSMPEFHIRYWDHSSILAKSGEYGHIYGSLAGRRAQRAQFIIHSPKGSYTIQTGMNVVVLKHRKALQAQYVVRSRSLGGRFTFTILARDNTQRDDRTVMIEWCRIGATLLFFILTAAFMQRRLNVVECLL